MCARSKMLTAWDDQINFNIPEDLAVLGVEYIIDINDVE